MIQQDHLQIYDLVLTIRSPLFVGSGRKYTQKEYMLNPRNNQVSFLDEQKFFAFLVRKGLVDAYEGFMLGQSRNLYAFLTEECGVSSQEMNGFIRYRALAAEALDKNGKLGEIHAFQRNANGQAYVPGSSVKGALRTVWLLGQVLDDHSPHALAHSERKNDGVPFPEAQYTHLLSLGEKREDAVNDIFRGILLSDSRPISDDRMMLAGKTDAFPGGGTNIIPLCRECVAPGTRLWFKLTLDMSVLKGRITVQELMRSIGRFDQYYCETYLPAFSEPRGAVPQMLNGKCLILGGGAGFFSKSLAYPYLGKEEGLSWTEQEMAKNFPKGKHAQDQERYGISPHTAKYTCYRQRLYPYGICEVTLQ